MLEYYLLSFIEEAAWQALHNGSLPRDTYFPGEYELDGGYAWTSRLTAVCAVDQLQLTLRNLEGPYHVWTAHHLQE